MVTQQEVERQLKAIGEDFKLWGHAEASELKHILVPGERIKYCINGRYEGGFAMLCITDQRVLLIDKKPFFLTLEDLRYDMVSEVDFRQRLLNATIVICTVNKNLSFMTWKGALLRRATSYLQNRVMEFRHQPATSLQLQQDTLLPESAVHALVHRVTNPYTKVPLMMRRRVSRFYGL